jgi:2-methylisocitrate lyase-like PEP mutase family enzyme
VSNNAQIFRALHHQTTALLLPNAWDAASAKLLELDGAKAIATSSAAMAWTLGYADGGALPRAELIAAIERIQRVISLPLTVDLEDGYSSDPQAVADLVALLATFGVVGINLEDGTSAPEVLVNKIKAIKSLKQTEAMFINARCDVYLRGMATDQAAIDMTQSRLAQYVLAGADGVFVPLLRNAADIKVIVSHCKAPLNVMSVPSLPGIDELNQFGVKRLSLGPTLFQTAYSHARAQANVFVKEGNISGLVNHSLPGSVLNNAFKP